MGKCQGWFSDRICLEWKAWDNLKLATSKKCVVGGAILYLIRIFFLRKNACDHDTTQQIFRWNKDNHLLSAHFAPLEKLLFQLRFDVAVDSNLGINLILFRARWFP